jgi:sterol desaturase/sphingolipid hydroxylase (fatty acid hydroxylase superfamily)
VPDVGRLIVGFLVLGALFGVVQACFPAIRGQKLFRRGFGTDLVYWLFTPLVSRPLTQLTVAIALLPLALYWGVPLQSLSHGHGPLGAQPAWAQAVQVLLLGDFLGYWQHRLFHRPALWRFHAVHHSSTDLDWLSSVRLHPVNDALGRVVQAVPIVALGYSPLAVAVYLPFTTFYALFLHANVGWDYGVLRTVIASPRFHRWHHTSEAEGRDANFAGLLPVWDLLFGTFHLPKGVQPTRFGVDDPVPTGFLGQMAYPFRRASTPAPAPAQALKS